MNPKNYSNKFKNGFQSILQIEILILIITIITSVYSYIIIFTDKLIFEYAYNELFINYQAGLIRRGLLGEIFWQLDKYFELNPKIFFGIIYYLLYLAQIYFFYILSKNFKDLKFLLIFILFSPALVLFNIYDINIFFVKDIFIKISILLHACLAIRLKEKDYINSLRYILIPLIAIVILIHEYQILFISIHVLISICHIASKKKLLETLKVYSLLIIPFVLILIFLGNYDQYQSLNDILQVYDIEVHPQLGGGFRSLLGGFYIWHFFYFSYNDFINLFFSILLSVLVPIIIFENLILKKIIIIKNFLRSNYWYFFLPMITCFLALDHGRNLSLVATHIFAFYMSLSLNKKKLIRFNDNITKNFNLLIILIVVTFFYVFLWKLDQYAGFALQGKETSIFKSSLFSEFIKLTKYLYSFIDLNVIKLPEIKLN
tara:strand:- start:4625 stop:5914 length:1290 start_codon:yes stop_codon:yes gene_type:complete